LNVGVFILTTEPGVSRKKFDAGKKTQGFFI
jgi:hypothetical protein